MEEIKAYKANSGKIFESKEEALKDDRMLAIKNDVEKFAEKHGIIDMDSHDLKEIILNNIDELKEILR
jgi:hypothetical protein